MGKIRLDRWRMLASVEQQDGYVLGRLYVQDGGKPRLVALRAGPAPWLGDMLAGELARETPDLVGGGRGK